MGLNKGLVRKLLDKAGIELNGNQPFDVRVNDERFFEGLFFGGTLFLGESYMRGWWDCDRLDQAIGKLHKSGAIKWIYLNPVLLWSVIRNYLSNLSDREKAYEIGEAHYDIGNDLFEKMLGRSMTYSCGYWKEADNLDEAQTAKLDLVCRKLGLKEGDRLLDIGCGWGSLVRHAAENYGVKAVGVTVSKEQAGYARKWCEDLPVEIRIQDYRDVNERFDHVASIGMFEHVGHKNYDEYMNKVFDVLKPGGRFLLHTIGKDSPLANADPWFAKYIFPNSEAPIRRYVNKMIRGKFHVWDWHEFGKYYDPTLMAWYENFEKAWPELKERYAGKVDGMFYRMWRFYLLVAAGVFRGGGSNLWQILLSRESAPDNYKKVR